MGSRNGEETEPPQRNLPRRRGSVGAEHEEEEEEEKEEEEEEEEEEEDTEVGLSGYLEDTKEFLLSLYPTNTNDSSNHHLHRCFSSEQRHQQQQQQQQHSGFDYDVESVLNSQQQGNAETDQMKGEGEVREELTFSSSSPVSSFFSLSKSIEVLSKSYQGQAYLKGYDEEDDQLLLSSLGSSSSTSFSLSSSSTLVQQQQQQLNTEPSSFSSSQGVDFLRSTGSLLFDSSSLPTSAITSSTAVPGYEDEEPYNSNNNNNNNHDFILTRTTVITTTEEEEDEAVKSEGVKVKSSNKAMVRIVAPPSPLSSPKKGTLIVTSTSTTTTTTTDEMTELRRLLGGVDDLNHLKSFILHLASSSSSSSSTSTATRANEIKRELTHFLSTTAGTPPSTRLTPLGLLRTTSGTGTGSPSMGELMGELRASGHVCLAMESKDWNGLFQRLLDEEDSEDKFRRISQLAHDFVYAASIYCKIIISERTLPNKQKTIEPVSAGVAGGQKFVLHNIFFKFAVDVNIGVRRGKGVWMFGGETASDENAMKGAAHELKGLMSYYSSQTPRLRFPLIALIDYKGFRVMASSIVPVSKKTIKYGSNDGGCTVHADIPELNDLMEKAAHVMNIQPHLGGISATTARRISSCTDLEVHLGDDHRYYVLDCARVMPPEAPILDPTRRDPRGVFFKLLRPELVRRFYKPLSSDSFTAFGRFDSSASRYNSETREATDFLQSELIPTYAEQLNSQYELLSDHFGLDELHESFLRLRLSEGMHRMGINVRFLGLLRSYITNRLMRTLLLMEMVVRVVKNMMRQAMREKMEDERALSEEPFRQVAVDYFNLLLWKKEEDPTENKLFWELVKSKIAKKFVFAFTPEEETEEVEQWRRLLGGAGSLVLRLSSVLGIRLSSQAELELRQDVDTNSFQAVYTDIVEIYAKSRQMDIIPHSEAMALSIMARNKHGAEGHRLLNLAFEKFDLALRTTPDNYLTLYHWALSLLQQLERPQHNPNTTQQQHNLVISSVLSEACAKLRQAVAINPGFDEGFLQLGNALLMSATMDLQASSSSSRRKQVYAEAAECFTKTLGLRPEEKDPLYERALEYLRRFSTSLSFRGPGGRRDTDPLHAASTLCKALHTRFPEETQPLLLWGDCLLEMVRNRTEYPSPKRCTSIGLKYLQAMRLDISIPSTSSSGGRDLLEQVLTRAQRVGQMARERQKKLVGVAVELYRALYTIQREIQELNEEVLLQLVDLLVVQAGSLSLLEYEDNIAFAGTVLTPLLEMKENSYDERLRHALLQKQGGTLSDVLLLAHFCPPLRDRFQLFSPQLHSITFKNCLYLSDITTGFFSPHCHSLESITIENSNNGSPSSFNDDTFAILLDSCKSLRTIRITSSTPLALATQQQQPPQPTSPLEQLTEKTIKHICTKAKQTLESFAWIGMEQLSEESIFLLASCPGLTSLDFSECRQIVLSPALASTTSSGANPLLLPAAPQHPNIAIGGGSTQTQYPKFMALKNLTLAGCPSLSDGLLITFIQFAVGLQSLTLDKCTHLTNRTVTAVASKLGSTLKHFSIAGLTKVNDKGILDLSAYCFVLESLNLQSLVNLTDSAIIALLNPSASLTTTTATSPTAAPPPSLVPRAVVPERRPCIRHLNLKGCKKLTNRTPNAIASFLAGFQTGEGGVGSGYSLSLSFDGCSQITDSGMESLLCGPMVSKSLKSLHLAKCVKLSNVSFKHISGLRALESLSLANCASVSSEVLETTFSFCTNLTELNISGVPYIQNNAIRALPCCKRLEHVNLEGCRLLTDDCFTSLRRCKRIKTLILNDCLQLTNKTVFFLTRLTELRVLSLNKCKHVSDESIIQLVVNVHGIEELYLRELTHLSDQSVENVAQNLPRLRIINLSGCIRITNHSLISLARHAKRLIELDVWGCVKVSDEGLLYLGKCSQSIRKVHLQGCPQITMTSVSWMKTNRPEVQLKITTAVSHRIMVGDVAHSSLFLAQLAANNPASDMAKGLSLLKNIPNPGGGPPPQTPPRPAPLYDQSLLK